MLPAIRTLAVTSLFVATLLAQQNQDVPKVDFGKLPVLGCDLREARFSHPFRTRRADGSEELHTAGWEVVVKGGPFPVRSVDPILWVDDVPLRNYDRTTSGGVEELVFQVVDPKLLRSEHNLQLIYGKDERTRTKLLERLDPEKLTRLPDSERRTLAIPDLEGVTLLAVGTDGKVAGRGHVSEGTIRLVARLANGSLQLLKGDVALDPQGRFAVDAGPLPNGTAQVGALLFLQNAALDVADFTTLPKGVELLDAKPVGTLPK
jgi:hypothetical protein